MKYQKDYVAAYEAFQKEDFDVVTFWQTQRSHPEFRHGLRHATEWMRAGEVVVKCPDLAEGKGLQELLTVFWEEHKSGRVEFETRWGGHPGVLAARNS